MKTSRPLLQLSESILYLSSLISDQSRPIDRYIDYFGGPTTGADHGQGTRSATTTASR
jgi:hypothetical protein